jgi:two-component system chemotaxis sensor kinase CheA
VSELDEIVGEFLAESYESLGEMDRDLLVLEQDPSAGETIGRIFRTIHTIKGTCGFLGFTRLESVAHAGESLLSRLRDGTLTMDDQISTELLGTVDAVREMLASIEATGSDGGADYGQLTVQLERLAALPAALPAADGRVLTGAPVAGLARAATTIEELPARSPDGEPTGGPAGQGVAGEAIAGESVPRRDVPEEAPHIWVERRVAVSDTSVRVDVALLDTLMNLVGELVLARNQILQLALEDQDSSFAASAQRLNLITTELQEGVMRTRLQPISILWNMLPRLVRDVARSCGKQIRLEMEGAGTELDKSIIEAIKDPLTHLVRNAVDHGIETPEARAAAGKPAEGHLRLQAFHEGGKINIDLVDDGTGIDAVAVGRRAVERGLLTEEQVAGLSQRELVNLIFLPGLSTAASVTSVSGRGVGMDVVKTNIETIGGSVEVQTERGRGTTLKIRIPLTLAIIPALVVESGRQRYAIPQASLVEVMRLEGERARHGIEAFHSAPVYRLRGRLLPVIDLADELAGGTGAAGRRAAGALNMVVLQADDRRFGLVVDEIRDTQEIVVKPLGRHVKDVSLYAGVTIMGDGRVALILDVMGLARRGHVVSEARERLLAQANAQAAPAEDRPQTLLLLGLGKDRRVAVPLSAVSRLEEFLPDAVERLGDRKVVQYRGEILPLVWVDSALGYVDSDDGGAAGRGEPLEVVVCAYRGQQVGLVVGRILDTVEERVGAETSMVIQGRVTEVIDIALVAGASPGSGAGTVRSAATGGGDQ